MRKPSSFWVVVVSIVVAASCGCHEETRPGDGFVAEGSFRGAYWPTSGWRACQPEEVGMDSARLQSLFDYVADPAVSTEGLVVVRNGYVVAEAYFGAFSGSSRHRSYSVAKSFVSALVGIAIDRGLLAGVQERVSRFFPAWQAADTPAAKRDMTVRHLLTMSSGLEWNEEDYYDDTSQNDVFRMAEEPDYIAYVLRKPSEFEPGSVWRYSSGDSMLLSGVIQEATGSTAYQFARDHLLTPLGLAGIQWDSDRAGHTVGGWGIQATVREYAKLGYLYLQRGSWEDRQLVPVSWVDESLSPVSPRVDFYGYQWWLAPVFGDAGASLVPPDTFLAWGIYGQQVFVLPSRQLVIVRVADDPGSDEWDEVAFLNLVVESVL